MGRLYARRDGADDDMGMMQFFTTGVKCSALPTMTLTKHSGNVGIGTTNPQADLHVAGDLIVDGVITNGPNKVVESNTTTLKEVLKLKPIDAAPEDPTDGDIYVGN